MEVKGQAQLPAPRSRVWATLIDPNALRHCLPGCQKFEQVAPDEWEATMSVGIAAVKGTYSGRVRLMDQVLETSYRLSIEARGAGNRIRGEGVITLADAPDSGTAISYHGDAHVLGPLAAVGQRLLPPAVRMLGEQFFACMGARIGGPIKEERS